jgi:RNA recognition motif-containing protein
MSKRIYVGNLPASFTQAQVKDLFARYGTVSSVEMSRDGTVSVEMSSGADKAIRSLNQKDMGGVVLKVWDVPMKR